MGRNKLKRVMKNTILVLLTIALIYCGYLIKKNLDEEIRIKEQAAEIKGTYDDSNPEYTITVLTQYIENEYGKTIKFDIDYSDLNEELGYPYSNTVVETLEESAPRDKNITETDAHKKVEILIALTTVLDEYTDEAIKKIPKTIVINKNPYSAEEYSAAAHTWIANNGEAFLMSLYYYPDEITEAYAYNQLYLVYTGTIHHEIFHCLDNYKLEDDPEWDSINEECSNLSNYACERPIEERAVAWEYMLNKDSTPNEQQAEYLLTNYGKYLKKTSE